MAFRWLSEDRVLEKVKISDQNTKRLAFHLPTKLWGGFLFSLWFVYFLFLFWMIHLTLFWSKKVKKRVLCWYVRHYLKWYFVYKGVDHYCTEALPKGFQKPTILFTLRLDEMMPLFISRLFTFPVIVPIRPEMSSFRASLFIPWSFMGRLFRFFSYPDQQYPESKPNIENTLKAGYSVVVPLNFNYTSPREDDELVMIQDVQDLVTDDVDCYILKLDGYESAKYAVFSDPIAVSVKCVPLKSVIGKYPLESRDAKVMIANYFGYSSVRMV